MIDIFTCSREMAAEETFSMSVVNEIKLSGKFNLLKDSTRSVFSIEMNTENKGTRTESSDGLKTL